MDGALELERIARQGPGHRIPESTAGHLAVLMDELAYGVLIATPKGRLLHANLAARRELARRRLLTLHEGQVQALEPSQARRLVQALARAEGGRRGLVALRGEGQRLSVAVLPLRPERPADPLTVALLLSRPAVCDPVMLCFFARAWGLTPSEEQVLGILCQGYSAPEAALQLKVAVSTVRSHVRSMCAKTHSNGVRALVGQVAVLPPIGTCQMQDPVH
jgi:DNA-binding CsgD family transcriptional regulator